MLLTIQPSQVPSELLQQNQQVLHLGQSQPSLQKVQTETFIKEKQKVNLVNKQLKAMCVNFTIIVLELAS